MLSHAAIPQGPCVANVLLGTMLLGDGLNTSANVLCIRFLCISGNCSLIMLLLITECSKKFGVEGFCQQSSSS